MRGLIHIFRQSRLFNHEVERLADIILVEVDLAECRYIACSACACRQRCAQLHIRGRRVWGVHSRYLAQPEAECLPRQVSVRERLRRREYDAIFRCKLVLRFRGYRLYSAFAVRRNCSAQIRRFFRIQRISCRYTGFTDSICRARRQSADRQRLTALQADARNLSAAYLYACQRAVRLCRRITARQRHAAGRRQRNLEPEYARRIRFRLACRRLCQAQVTRINVVRERRCRYRRRRSGRYRHNRCHLRVGYTVALCRFHRRAYQRRSVRRCCFSDRIAVNRQVLYCNLARRRVQRHICRVPADARRRSVRPKDYVNRLRDRRIQRRARKRECIRPCYQRLIRCRARSCAVHRHSLSNLQAAQWLIENIQHMIRFTLAII